MLGRRGVVAAPLELAIGGAELDQLGRLFLVAAARVDPVLVVAAGLVRSSGRAAALLLLDARVARRFGNHAGIRRYGGVAGPRWPQREIHSHGPDDKADDDPHTKRAGRATH